MGHKTDSFTAGFFGALGAAIALIAASALVGLLVLVIIGMI